MKNVYYVGSGELTFDLIERIINENLKLELAPEAKERIQKCRDYLDKKTAESAEPLYGITTGFGSLCSKSISPDELGTLQEKDTFIEDIDRDSEAYDSVFACFKMPKATDEEKAARSAAIQEATKFAALVPMQVARNAYELMTVIMDVARLGNRNAVTDACVAMMSARSAVLGALMNVRINLGSLKDKEFVAKLQAEACELERLACAKEKELLDEINEELKV